MPITKRGFLRMGGSLCACGGAHFGALGTAHAALPAGGCMLLSDDVERSDRITMFSASDERFSTGNGKLDGYLGKALVRIAAELGVRPAFGFYEKMNAQASPEITRGLSGTWGTVLFGRPLFTEELERRDNSGMTVLAIIAHEFGHIVQFKNNLDKSILAGQPTVKRLELHADILAGFYLGIVKRKNPSLSMYSAGEVFHRIGDSNFNSQNHHGTPDERASASNFGFQHGLAGTTSLAQVIQMGVNYVKNK